MQTFNIGQHSTLDHDAPYLRDVLGLQDGETEEQADERLKSEAKQLGIDVDAQLAQQTKPLSTRTFSSEAPRRSESINSRASQSTGMTSDFSELSREAHQPFGRRRSRASLSFRDYDNFLARGIPNGRMSMSFSPPTTPSHSTFSLTLSTSERNSPKKHFRRLRGLIMPNRVDSNSSDAEGCPHCPQGPLSQRRAAHKLPCGHRLCTQALRNTIKTATETKTGAVPSCCGKPVPGSLVEHVMTQQEQSELLDRLEQWDEAASIAPSMVSNGQESGTVKLPFPLSRASRTLSDESKVDSVAPQLLGDLDKIPDRPGLGQLRKEQMDMPDRFTTWMEKQRVELERRHEGLRSEMRASRERAAEDLEERHADAMAEAEDKQVKAEADMRKMHNQEKRDNATALKHMEAYCAGTYSTGEAHDRTITDQDRAELEKARRIRETTDVKHESAINVLRGEQGRRMKLRAQRQEKEVQELRRAQRMEELELERSCTSEVHRLDDIVAQKRSKMRARWELQTAISTKQMELESSLATRGRLPSIEWQQDVPHAAPGASRPRESTSIKSGISSGFAVSGMS